MLTDTDLLTLAALNLGGLAYGVLGALIYDHLRPERRAARRAQRRTRKAERLAAQLASLSGNPVELRHAVVVTDDGVELPTDAEVAEAREATDGAF